MGGAGGIAALHTAGRTVQLQRISFVPAQHPDTAPLPEGVDIIYLGGSTKVSPDMTASVEPRKSEIGRRKSEIKELFRQEDIRLNWTSVRRTGAGLENLGNTCFLNSVLQCLTHTPPLAEVLLNARPLGSASEWDALRLTQQHVARALHNRSRVISPRPHANGLRRVCRSFRRGRQEDAHEYLVALLDAMHEAALAGLNPKPPREVAETSLIYRIFAGQSRSQVKCCECGYESNTMESFMDICLDISRAPSLTMALERYTKPEMLDRENKYKCPKQGRLVRARKTITIERAPNVLVFQLKRFEYSMYGSKIGKKVDFDTHLDMAPYMSNRRAGPQMYELFGVLVHAGHSVHSGHYFCFVRAPNGLWHRMDDVQVSQVSERVVLGQKAYILFYIKSPVNGRSASAPPPPRSDVAQATASQADVPVRACNSVPQPRRPASAAPVSDEKGSERPSVKRKLSSAFPALDAAAQERMAAAKEAGTPQAPQVKHKGVLHKMEKGAMSAPAEGKRGGVKSEDADVDIEKGSHAEASVSPFASFKVEEVKPVLAGLVDGVKPSSSVKLRPRPSLVLPLKTALGVAGSPGGRSWKRRQELVSLHSSALQRKLSSTASLDGLSCHSAGRATRAAASKMRPAAAADRGHLPNGVPSLRPPGSTLAGSTSGADSEEAAGAPPARSPKQRRLSRQQQEVETGNNNAALPKPDLSGVACVGAAASAASQEKQEKGSVQQQQGSKSSRQESSAAGTSDSDSAGEMPTARNNDLFGLGSQQQLTPVSQPEEAPVAAVGNGPGKGAAVHTSTDPAEVRAFLQGSAGASGLNVSKWDTADEELVKRAEVFSRKSAPKRGRPRDEWDTDYDRGKQKKVRNRAPDEWKGGNEFQQFSNIQQHRGGRGGGSRGGGGGRGKQQGSWGRGGGRGGGRGRSFHRGGGRSGGRGRGGGQGRH
ncbi:hypothetical protein WJX75_008782 [Coccomyxa subellipsoidea]|uniref:Ubiquitin carboxyl-terminal hydrolase n=1 Tax=Coccomyxa subellipsoidea TaxID=248742 RepID=A0ABR2YZ36_9CHLO